MSFTARTLALQDISNKLFAADTLPIVPISHLVQAPFQGKQKARTVYPPGNGTPVVTIFAEH